MPRRYPDYALQFADFNAMVTVGAFLFGLTQLLFLFIVVKAIRGGKKATSEVWEDNEQWGLEWFECQLLIILSQFNLRLSKVE